MSCVSTVYIDNVFSSNTYALIFRKKNNPNILYAFIPQYIKNDNIKVCLFDDNLFECKLLMQIEELAICIYSIVYQETENISISISIDIDKYVNTLLSGPNENVKDRIVKSNLFPRVPTIKLIGCEEFINYDSTRHIESIKSVRPNIYLYAPFILSLINTMIENDINHLKQININIDYCVSDTQEEPPEENVAVLLIAENSSSYPNGKGKFIFRKGGIISEIDNHPIPSTFTFECPSELGQLPLKINIPLYLAIKSTFNNHINMVVSKLKNKTPDNHNEEYITKTYKISGLYYDKIYSTHINKSDNNIVYKNLSLTELSEELLYTISDKFTPSLELVNNVSNPYNYKRIVVMTEPKFDKKNKEFSLWFVDSVNGKVLKNISDLEQKISKNNTRIEFKCYLNGNLKKGKKIYL